MKNTEYWLWYWGINQKDEAIHSKKKKFTYSNSRKPCSLDPLGQGWIEKK